DPVQAAGARLLPLLQIRRGVQDHLLLHVRLPLAAVDPDLRRVDAGAVPVVGVQVDLDRTVVAGDRLLAVQQRRRRRVGAVDLEADRPGALGVAGRVGRAVLDLVAAVVRDGERTLVDGPLLVAREAVLGGRDAGAALVVGGVERHRDRRRVPAGVTVRLARVERVRGPRRAGVAVRSAALRVDGGRVARDVRLLAAAVVLDEHADLGGTVRPDAGGERRSRLLPGLTVERVLGVDVRPVEARTDPE